MIGLEIDGGKHHLEYDGEELVIVSHRCRSTVCDANLKDVLLSLMRENIAMKAKFANMLMLSNTATRARVKRNKKKAKS